MHEDRSAIQMSAWTSRGAPVSPQTAYAGLPLALRLGAVLCDAWLVNKDWALSVLDALEKGTEDWTKSRTALYMQRCGWTTVDDVYDAAALTPAQIRAFDMYLLGFTAREIGQVLGIDKHAAEMRVYRAQDKLRKAMPPLDEGKHGPE